MNIAIDQKAYEVLGGIDVFEDMREWSKFYGQLENDLSVDDYLLSDEGHLTIYGIGRYQVLTENSDNRIVIKDLIDLDSINEIYGLGFDGWQ